MIVNPIMVDNFANIFKCMTASRASRRQTGSSGTRTPSTQFELSLEFMRDSIDAGIAIEWRFLP